MINFILIGNDKYWVDVGYGPNGPVFPVRLPDKAEAAVASNIAPSSLRLEYKMPYGCTDSSQRLWCFAIRINDESPWQEMYAFTELEFLTTDYDVMNYHTSTRSSEWFTQKIVCSKMLTDTEGQIEGVVIVQDSLKIRKNGKTVLSNDFKHEGDRLKALEEHFGITFAAYERDGIRGLPSEIKTEGSSSSIG